MAELPLNVVSQDAMAMFKTNRMMIALNTFISLSFLCSSPIQLNQVKKLVIANTEISVMLTYVIILSNLMVFSPPVLVNTAPPRSLHFPPGPYSIFSTL